jgi:hypothetical protein
MRIEWTMADVALVCDARSNAWSQGWAATSVVTRLGAGGLPCGQAHHSRGARLPDQCRRAPRTSGGADRPLRGDRRQGARDRRDRWWFLDGVRAQPRVHPTVAWAKLQALAEGATLATQQLWGPAAPTRPRTADSARVSATHGGPRRGGTGVRGSAGFRGRCTRRRVPTS